MLRTPLRKAGCVVTSLTCSPTDVDLGSAFSQPGDIFLACPGWHSFSSSTRNAAFPPCRYCPGASCVARERRHPRPPALAAAWRLLLRHPVGLFVELENEFPVRAITVYIVFNVLPPACGHFVKIEPVAGGALALRATRPGRSLNGGRRPPLQGRYPGDVLRPGPA